LWLRSGAWTRSALKEIATRFARGYRITAARVSPSRAPGGEPQHSVKHSATSTRTVVLLVDEGPRDLPGLILLSLHLVSQGLRVVISDRALKDLVPLFPDGVFFGKEGLRSVAEPLGITIAFHPSEGGFFAENGWIDTVRDKHFVDSLTQAAPKSIFVWGEQQRSVLMALDSALGEAAVVSGSQRLDLALSKNHWISESARSALIERFGDFILITSRFTTILNEHPRGSLYKLLRREAYSQPEQVQSSRWSKDAVDLGFFIPLIRRLVKEFPQESFVLRPHPAEDIMIYQGLFGDLRNLTVSREGNLLPWVLASKMLVTCNSTSGVEAVLAGKPTLNFSSSAHVDPETRISVAWEAGERVGSIEAALEAARRRLTLQTSASPQVWSKVAKARLANLSHEATPIIVRKLVDMAQISRPSSSVPVKKLRHVLARSQKHGDYFTRKLIALSTEELQGILQSSLEHGFRPTRLLFHGNGTTVLEPDTERTPPRQPAIRRKRL
jgi:surface carbohydrate biosynthesis protein